MSKFDIDSYVEQLASNKNIKNFYPTAVSKALSIPFAEVISRLNDLVKIGYIELKYEIRCDVDFNLIDIVDDYSDILGSSIECYQCGEDIDITFENIIPVYYINSEYRETLKKKSRDSAHFIAIDYNQAYDKDSQASLSDILVQEANIPKSDVDELSKQVANKRNPMQALINVGFAFETLNQVQSFFNSNEWARQIFKNAIQVFKNLPK